MFCRNCGKELPDSAKFCSGCGTPVAPAVSQPAPTGEEAVRETAAENMAAGEIPEPLVEETPAENTPETPVMETPTVFFQPTAPAAVDTPVTPDTPVVADTPITTDTPAAEDIPAPVQKCWGKIGIAVIGLGVVAAIVLAVLWPFSGVVGGNKRTPAFAYLNDDSELMYLANLKKKTEAIEVSDEVDAGKGAMGIVAMDNVKFSSDGKTIYFLNEQDSLYKISVSDLKKDERPERIAREVISFSVLDSGYVLYQKKGISIDIVGYFELNCYDGKNSFRISKGYNDYQLSQDQKTVYYADPNKNDKTLTLYKRALKENADPEELLSGATDIYTDFDADILVYGEDKRDSDKSSVDADQNTLTVYSCKPGGEPAELVSGICSIYSVDVDGGNVSFYYDRDERQEYKLYDLVSDAQQSADAAITAQDLVWPDWYGPYYPDEVYEQNGSAYYRTSLGASFPIDTSELQASTGLSVAELLANLYYDVLDLAYANAEERYNADVEEYNNKYDEWNAANNRNQMRESLKNESYTQHTRDIYHYTGSADAAPIITSIDENQFAASYEDGIFIYKKTAGIAGGKACDLADLNYYGEIYDHLDSGSGGGEWYQNVGGVESVLDLDEESSVNDVIVLNGTEAVLRLSEDGDAWLDAYTVGDTALTFSNTVVDDEFIGLRKAQDTKGSDVLYFFTNVEEEDYGKLGDFNRYSSGKTEVVAKEVYGVHILEDSGTIYVGTDIDVDGTEYSLVQDGKLITISDDCSGFIFLDGKQMLYIANDNLYLWNGKENRRIAKDVEYVWANTKERYIPYGPYGPL